MWIAGGRAMVATTGDGEYFDGDTIGPRSDVDTVDIQRQVDGGEWETIVAGLDPDPTIPDDPTVDDWDGLGGIWPNEGLLREGGIIWRNVSGVPLTTPPSGFPGVASQWGHLFVIALAPEPEPPAPTVAAWSATTTYTVGARCTKDGRVWECLVAHGAEQQGGWGPPATGVWVILAPSPTVRTTERQRE